MKRIRAVWASLWQDADRRVRMGRILGFLFITGGFVIMGIAWNGSASINFVQGQMPYLLSGGFLGLALVITGCTLLLLSTVRSERQVMTDLLSDVSRLLSRNLARSSVSSNGSGDMEGQVVATDAAYHRPDCRVLQGKQGLATVSVQAADAEGLEPCRVCNPPVVAKTEETTQA